MICKIGSLGLYLVFLTYKVANCTVLSITMVFCSRICKSLKQKNPSYSFAKQLINTGSITSLKQALNLVGLRQIVRDTSLKYSTLQKRSYNPEKYRLEEFTEIARIFEINTDQVLKLAENDVKPVNKKQKS